MDITKRDDAPTVNGHTAQLRYLAKTKQNLPPEDGREFTLKFFQKVWNHRGESASRPLEMSQMDACGVSC